MTLPDPFNPVPGPLPGDETHQHRHGFEPQGGGKTYLWVPLGILGAIALFYVVAAL